MIFTKNIELILSDDKKYISVLKINGIIRNTGKSKIFAVRLCGKDGSRICVDSSKARNVYTDGADVIYSDFGDELSELSTKVSVCSEESRIEWRISVSGIPRDLALEWVEFPKIHMPKLVDNNRDGGRIIFPYDEGILLTDETLLPRYEPEFPMSGAYFIFPNKLCSQFMGYLFSDCGLYIGAHDKTRGFKGIDFYREDEGISMHVRLYSGSDFGESYAPDFPVVWECCGSHWKSAANVYREWFEKNLPSNLISIENNKNLPKWYEDSPLIVTYPVRGIHDMDKMEPNALFPYINAMPHLNKIKAGTDCNVMALLMHWEGTAPWAPPYMWPPYGGVQVFNEFRDELHKNGDLLGVYCSGFGYTSQSTLIEEYNCEERIKNENVLEGVCHSPANKPEKGITCCPYQRYGYDICPASKRGREILSEGFDPIFKCGADYAQILDQNHGGGQYMCYSRDHGHPPMPGEWMTSNMQNLLGKWNESAPNMLFGCESAASEPFIGNLLMSDNRYELNYPYGTPVPVYAYIYHRYVRNFMGNQCGCPFEPECDTVRYRLAYSFSVGDLMTLTLAPNGNLMSHWGTHDFEHAPDMDKALLFIKNVMRFYNNEGKKYLYSGRMSLSPDIECEEINIPLFRGRKIANLPRLLASSWEAENGRVAYIIVNPEETEVDFTVNKKSYKAPPLNAMLIEI